MTYNNGLPMSETLAKGSCRRLVFEPHGSDRRKARLVYRSAHDGYVWAYGAWPFTVDVRSGLAAVTYGGSSVETDGRGETRTGLLGCQCVNADGGIELACATAPYVQHIDDSECSTSTRAQRIALALGRWTCRE